MARSLDQLNTKVQRYYSEINRLKQYERQYPDAKVHVILRKRYEAKLHRTLRTANAHRRRLARTDRVKRIQQED